MRYALRASWQWMGFALLSAAIFLSATTNSPAFEGLTEAQNWIYDRNHLTNTTAGQQVEYSYSSTNDNAEKVSDVATLSILQDAGDNRRDVEIDFLSDERHLALPPFPGYRGNPMIIAMLEHIAQSIGNETGGGVLYFRNRIRDALASDKVELVDSKSQYGDMQVDSTTLRFFPFEGDSYLKSHPLYLNAEFLIEISDEVPAGVVSVSVSAEQEDQNYSRQLIIR